MAQGWIFLIKTLPGTAAAASLIAEGICASRNPARASFHFILTLGHAVLKGSNPPNSDFFFFFPRLFASEQAGKSSPGYQFPPSWSLLQGMSQCSSPVFSCCASQMTPRASGKCFLLLKPPRSDFFFTHISTWWLRYSLCATH